MAKKPKVKTGRPLIEIDEDELFKLASFHCTDVEIAAFFDFSVDTLNRRFAEILRKGREQGKRTLRKLQWNSAIGGNTTMLIWLGKQILKQTDKIEQEITTVDKDTRNYDEMKDELIKLIAQGLQ